MAKGLIFLGFLAGRSKIITWFATRSRSIGGNWDGYFWTGDADGSATAHRSLRSLADLFARPNLPAVALLGAVAGSRANSADDPGRHHQHHAVDARVAIFRIYPSGCYNTSQPLEARHGS